MEFFFKAMNTRRIQTRFDRMGAAALNPRPAFKAMLYVLFEIEEALFDSEGRRGGGSWRPVTDSCLNLDPRVNHASLTMRHAVTKMGAKGQVRRYTENGLIFGLNLPYAATTQKNRPIFKFTERDRFALRNQIRHHLVQAWEATVDD
jgi:hypothetical protein